MALRLGAAGLLLSALMTSTPCTAETIHIKVDNLAFTPAKISAHVGDTIEWTNAGVLVHTATARDNAWDVMLPVKGSGQLTLKKAGEVEYYCRFHPNMVGHISVTEK
jgi:plastocyanin